jgi:hypothetical protein
MASCVHLSPRQPALVCGGQYLEWALTATSVTLPAGPG